jgi:chromate transporter
MSVAFPGAGRTPASPAELFRVFNRLALQGFGGGVAIAQHELVERQRWMSQAQFVEMLSIGQVLPGPNVVNLAMMVGDRFFGWRGALAALGGMLLLPMLLVLALAALYGKFAQVPAVAGALRGMGAVAAGLVIATALKLLPSLKGNALGPWICAAFTLLTVAAIAVLRWPMVWVIGGLGSAAMALAWWRLLKR